jgi:flagellin FlaB
MKYAGVKKLRKKDEEGDMGIGTMILFIAMVLVAAVAAALLISTASELNQQAQETGRIAQQEVSSGFVVVDKFGVVPSGDTTSPSIDDFYLKMRLSAGSPVVDMDNVVIEIQSDSFEASLILDDDGLVDDATHYSVEDASAASGVVRDPEAQYGSAASGKHIVSQGTIILVHINIDYASDSADDGAGGLTSQDVLHIKIIPKHGAPTYEQINVPEVVYGQSASAVYVPLS